MTSLDFLHDQLDWLSRCFDRVRAPGKSSADKSPGYGTNITTQTSTDVFNRNPSTKPQTPPPHKRHLQGDNWTSCRLCSSTYMQVLCSHEAKNLLWVSDLCLMRKYMFYPPLYTLFAMMADPNWICSKLQRTTERAWLFLWVASLWFRTHGCKLEKRSSTRFQNDERTWVSQTVWRTVRELETYWIPLLNKSSGEATQFFTPADRWQLFVTETDCAGCWECRPDVEAEEGQGAQTAPLGKTITRRPGQSEVRAAE